MGNESVFRGLYGGAKQPADLPWNHREPSAFVADAVAILDPGRALDLGCGTGTDSVYLAQHGWTVTSLDFMPEAVEMTRERAEQAGVSLDARVEDVTTWPGTGVFDLIVDAGCLHGLDPAYRDEYRHKLLAWLAAGGTYILRHAEKCHLLDWRPMGPRRVSRRKILRLFGPELRERDFHRKVFTGVKLPFGPSFTHTTYWFQRKSG